MAELHVQLDQHTQFLSIWQKLTPRKDDVFASTLNWHGIIDKDERHPVGAGGSGVVYKGKWINASSLGETPPEIAVKLLHFVDPRKEHASSRKLKMLQRETSVWKLLQHKNIVPFMGLIYEPLQFPALVSLWMTNGPIKDYIAHHPSVSKTNLLKEVAEGLEYLHSFEPCISHGDVKADNILVDSLGVPRLTDFGIAQLNSDHTLWQSSTANAKGTLRWMAPEFLIGEAVTASPQGDIYAFGMTSLEIFSGQLPFYDLPTDVQVWHAVAISKAQPNVPDGVEASSTLQDLWQGCWQRDADLRPSMTKIVVDMKEICRSEARGEREVYDQGNKGSDRPTERSSQTCFESNSPSTYLDGETQCDLNRFEELGTELKTTEKSIGATHTSTLDLIHRLGRAYYTASRLPDAQSMLERAVTGREQILGPEHPSTLNSVHSLALVYLKLGSSEAVRMFERAVVGRVKVLGPDHPSTLDSVHNLGVILRKLDRVRDAEKASERAADGREMTLGQDHPSTLDSVNNLGVVYSRQGRLLKAEHMFKRVLSGREKLLGPEHVSTYDALYNLASVLRKQRRSVEAGKLFEKAMAFREKTFGIDDASTLECVSNLGKVYSMQGHLKEAEAMHQRAATGREKAYGAYHASTLASINNLGVLYEEEHRFLEAEQMYKRAFDGREITLGRNHLKTLESEHSLAVVYRKQGRLVEASRTCERVIVGREKVFGISHELTLDTLYELGTIYEERGMVKEAQLSYKRVLVGREKILGVKHPSTLDAFQKVQSMQTRRKSWKWRFKKLLRL